MCVSLYKILDLYKISLYEPPKRIARRKLFIPAAIYVCFTQNTYIRRSGTSFLLIGPFHLQNELLRSRKSNRPIRPFSPARPLRILHPRKSNIRLYS